MAKVAIIRVLIASVLLLGLAILFAEQALLSAEQKLAWQAEWEKTVRAADAAKSK